MMRSRSLLDTKKIATCMRLIKSHEPCLENRHARRVLCLLGAGWHCAPTKETSTGIPGQRTGVLGCNRSFVCRGCEHVVIALVQEHLDPMGNRLYAHKNGTLWHAMASGCIAADVPKIGHWNITQH